jgi:methionine-S-sulfoxide reductase
MKKIPAIALLFAIVNAVVVDPARGQDSPPSPTKTAIFAGVCFWCIQPEFDKAKRRHQNRRRLFWRNRTESYPTNCLLGKDGYRESIEITYDPTKISYDQLLDIYWRQIDPTQADGQFTDIGPSYRAAIFYNDNKEKKIAEASKEKLARSGKFEKPIATEILPAMKFYPAEAYHQKYYQQNPEHFEAFEKGSGRVSFEKKTWALDR